MNDATNEQPTCKHCGDYEQNHEDGPCYLKDIEAPVFQAGPCEWQNPAPAPAPAPEPASPGDPCPLHAIARGEQAPDCAACGTRTTVLTWTVWSLDVLGHSADECEREHEDHCFARSTYLDGTSPDCECNRHDGS